MATLWVAYLTHIEGIGHPAMPTSQIDTASFPGRIITCATHSLRQKGSVPATHVLQPLLKGTHNARQPGQEFFAFGMAAIGD
jgi:hypothetical protein